MYYNPVRSSPCKGYNRQPHLHSVQEKLDFWDNVYGFDMSCIKRLAIAEPLVDLVDRDQICTNAAQARCIDIHTIKKDDVNFEAPFSLIAVRDDHIHALVTYFDVEFKASHK